jgi:hypothetical protein
MSPFLILSIVVAKVTAGADCPAPGLGAAGLLGLDEVSPGRRYLG